jgi:hypothetical protein
MTDPLRALCSRAKAEDLTIGLQHATAARLVAGTPYKSCASLATCAQIDDRVGALMQQALDAAVDPKSGRALAGRAAVSAYSKWLSVNLSRELYQIGRLWADKHEVIVADLLECDRPSSAPTSELADFQEHVRQLQAFDLISYVVYLLGSMPGAAEDAESDTAAGRRVFVLDAVGTTGVASHATSAATHTTSSVGVLTNTASTVSAVTNTASTVGLLPSTVGAAGAVTNTASTVGAVPSTSSTASPVGVVFSASGVPARAASSVGALASTASTVGAYTASQFDSEAAYALAVDFASNDSAEYSALIRKTFKRAAKNAPGLSRHVSGRPFGDSAMQVRCHDLFPRVRAILKVMHATCEEWVISLPCGRSPQRVWCGAHGSETLPAKLAAAYLAWLAARVEGELYRAELAWRVCRREPANSLARKAFDAHAMQLRALVSCEDTLRDLIRDA